MTILLFFLLFSLSTLASPLAAHFASRADVVDLPGGRRTHIDAVPRAGGVAVFVPLLFALPLLTPRAAWYPPLVIGIGGLVMLGALDDAFSLSPLLRLGVQGVICAVCLALTFPAVLLFEMVPSLFFLLSLINAANFLDGIDALLLSLSVPPLIALSLVSHTVAPIALATCALLLGFLPWNLPRARIFLGDSGSTTLGFLLGYLAIVSLSVPTEAVSLLPSAEVHTAQQIARPYPSLVLLYLVFFLDLTTTTLGRILRGVSPFRPDRTHIHHRLSSLVGESRTRRLLFFLSVLSSVSFLLAITKP